MISNEMDRFIDEIEPAVQRVESALRECNLDTGKAISTLLVMAGLILNRTMPEQADNELDRRIGETLARAVIKSGPAALSSLVGSLAIDIPRVVQYAHTMHQAEQIVEGDGDRGNA